MLQDCYYSVKQYQSLAEAKNIQNFHEQKNSSEMTFWLLLSAVTEFTEYI